MTCCRRTLNKIDGIDSLTVDLFNRLTRTIRSQSIFFIDRSIDCDRIALVDLLNRSTVIESFLSIFLKIENIERSKIERSKDQIPNPESSYVQREIIILICIKNLFWLGHRRVFLCSKDPFNREKDQIAPVDLFLRYVFVLFNLFQRLTRVI